MADYSLAPTAERELEEIWRYTSQHWGFNQAHRYVDILTAAFETLAQSPLSAPPCDQVRTGYRRYGTGRHMIYFRIAERGIIIVRILHDRMDAPRHL